MKDYNYIGINQVQAMPMTKEDFDRYCNGETPKYEGENIGYVLAPNGKYRYASWSPKLDFEKQYMKYDSLTFGIALELLKQGKRIARESWRWNGKDMYLFLLKGGVSGNEVHNQCSFIETDTPILDCICMKTAQDTVCVGWLASQTDMLSDDWCVVE